LIGELDDELASHVSMAEDDNVRQGMTKDEARREARLALGGTPQLRDAHRDVRGLPLVSEFMTDVRHGVRTFAKNPGFGAIVIVILAIGIGANTAMFSVLHGVLVRPLSYPESDRVVFIGRVNAGQGAWLSLPRIEATASSVTTLQGFGAYLVNGNEDVTFAGRGEPETLRGARVSANFLDILQVKPVVGRSFLPEEGHPWWSTRGDDQR
jgi:hypothetical protein